MISKEIRDMSLKALKSYQKDLGVYIAGREIEEYTELHKHIRSIVREGDKIYTPPSRLFVQCNDDICWTPRKRPSTWLFPLLLGTVYSLVDMITDVKAVVAHGIYPVGRPELIGEEIKKPVPKAWKTDGD